MKIRKKIREIKSYFKGVLLQRGYCCKCGMPLRKAETESRVIGTVKKVRCKCGKVYLCDVEKETYSEEDEI